MSVDAQPAFPAFVLLFSWRKIPAHRTVLPHSFLCGCSPEMPWRHAQTRLRALSLRWLSNRSSWRGRLTRTEAFRERGKVISPCDFKYSHDCSMWAGHVTFPPLPRPRNNPQPGKRPASDLGTHPASVSALMFLGEALRRLKFEHTLASEACRADEANSTLTAYVCSFTADLGTTVSGAAAVPPGCV